MMNRKHMHTYATPFLLPLQPPAPTLPSLMIFAHTASYIPLKTPLYMTFGLSQLGQ